MRRHYLVNPSFQIQFTLFFVLGILFILTFIGGLGIGTLHYVSTIATITPAQKIFLIDKARDLFWMVMGVGGVLTVAFFFAGMILSFKVMGPLTRMEIWLERIVQGHDPMPLQLRPKDEMSVICDLLNSIREQWLESKK